MTLQCLQPQCTGIHLVLTERQSGIGYDFAMRATPVYFQWSGLTMRQNGIERVPRLHLLCTRVSNFLVLTKDRLIVILCLNNFLVLMGDRLIVTVFEQPSGTHGRQTDCNCV